MGRLIDGNWTKISIISSGEKGDYQRIPRSFREQVSESHEVYQPESGRYHLYVSYVPMGTSLPHIPRTKGPARAYQRRCCSPRST